MGKDLSSLVMARLVRAIAARTCRDGWPGRVDHNELLIVEAQMAGTIARA